MEIHAKIRSPSIKANVTRACTEMGSEYDFYDGEYEFVPKTVPQTAETKNKTLKDNITVLSIPYFEVSNTDGTTVIIGE